MQARTPPVLASYVDDAGRRCDLDHMRIARRLSKRRGVDEPGLAYGCPPIDGAHAQSNRRALLTHRAPPSGSGTQGVARKLSGHRCSHSFSSNPSFALSSAAGPRAPTSYLSSLALDSACPLGAPCGEDRITTPRGRGARVFFVSATRAANIVRSGDPQAYRSAARGGGTRTKSTWVAELHRANRSFRIGKGCCRGVPGPRSR